jgi:hypothetical protein
MPRLRRGEECCALAAQVQARTQQLAAEEGQGEQLLDRTHGRNLTAAESGLQLRDVADLVSEIEYSR